MTKSSRHIIFLSLEKHLQDKVLTEVLETFAIAEGNGLDFYTEELPIEVNEFAGKPCRGAKVAVKHKESCQEAELTYYAIPSNNLSLGDDNFKDELRKIAPAKDIVLVFCFDYSVVQDGYEPFDYINEDTTNLFKYQFTEFLYRMGDFDCYHLIYADAHSAAEEIEILYLAETLTKKYIHGLNFSWLLHRYRKELPQYDHFLRLPTILLHRNIFLPKIPF